MEAVDEVVRLRPPTFVANLGEAGLATVLS